MPKIPGLTCFDKWRDSVLIRNTIWIGLGMTARLGIQIVYFVLVARSLKTGEYGVFSGTLGLIMFVAPFVSWGSGNILIKNVSRDTSLFREYWGAALATILLSGMTLTSFTVLLGWLVLPAEQPIFIVLGLTIGEFFGVRLNDVAAQAFQAMQRLRVTSLLYVSISALRLASAGLFFLSPLEKTAADWSLVYMISSLLAGLLGILLVTWQFGFSPIRLGPMRRAWREGFFFSVGLSAQNVHGSIDKPLLLRFSGDVNAGAYAAAYRFLDAASVPMHALISASYPRFFQHGASGIRESMRYALRLLPWAVAMGLGAWLGLLLLRPFILFLLGEEYRLSLVILAWLAAIPLLRAFSHMTANTLTGADMQPIRTKVQLGIAGLNLLLNLWLIPTYGWLGAAWSSLISEGLLAAALSGIIIFQSHNQGWKVKK